MHVAIFSSALPGLGPQLVGERAGAVWRETRPTDVVDVYPISDGVVVDHVGTGLDEVVVRFDPTASATQVDDAPRRIWWKLDSDAGALCDLADSLTWSGTGDPRGSTEFLGTDLRHLANSGVSRVFLHVPSLMRNSDGGVGLLSALSGVEFTGDVPSADELAQALEQARSVLGRMDLVVSYDAEQPLTGVNGMARAWADRGFDAGSAQEAERTLGQLVTHLKAAQARGAHRSLLGAEPDSSRSPFAGVGGGLGMMLSALGARVRSIGELLVPDLSDDLDLCIYVCDAIGMDLPAGLSALTPRAEELGVPVVVVTDSSGLRKGELPKLGLHGAYELRPNRAFLDEPNSMADLAELPGLLDETIKRVAHTWGWSE